MQKIRKNDQVLVISGKDKGRRGTVTRVDGDKIYVENVNVAKKHQKPNPAKNLPSGIIEREMPIHRSKVMLFNSVSQKGDRVSIRALEDGRRVRVFKSNKEVVDV
jgi:large subunit ribosomal protein L24